MSNEDATETEAAVAASEPATNETEPKATGSNSEAAKWRVKFREAEAERDQWKQRVESNLRATAETMAEDDARLPKGSALWAAGIKLEDLLTDDYTIDNEKVHQAATTTAETLGISLARQMPHTSALPENTPPEDLASWSTALKGL